MPYAICNAAVDWAATGTMLQGIGTVGGVGAVVWAAIKGANTFDTWRRQKLVERKLDQAERILTAAYKGRRALGYVRGVMMWGHELHAAQEQMKEKDGWGTQTEARQKRLVTAQAFYNRINRTKDEREALDQCLPMARALFSEELEQAIEKLNHQFWMVQVDVDSYVDDEGGTDAEFTKKLRRGMYAINPPAGEVNEVTEAMEVAVATIERICLPVLRLEASAAAG
ncbi:hypothetical protein DFR49_1538 [Hephaestia caeni]|uniref:Uncharacterized protein n=2 Tax=Hephaestia caeni TaxID=645617 RepID=A0A397PLI3_9SPHN|nr:hypothetical protein DFR49_1538 [Hephaestia caeni]